MPYSATGDSYKLRQYGATNTAGRWLARVDEEVQYGGCKNDSGGLLMLDTPYLPMLGAYQLNVSGPCFKRRQSVMLQIDELTLVCTPVRSA